MEVNKNGKKEKEKERIEMRCNEVYRTHEEWVYGRCNM